MGKTPNLWKYARPEFERRFLLSKVPPGRVVRRRQIVDRYFMGAGLRLRMVVSEAGNREYKLTQKVAEPVGGGGARITTMYLPPAAHRLLCELPGAELRKTRLSIPPFGIDLFEGALDHLVLAECEASSAADLQQFASPVGTVAEVTEDERFTGGHLASTTADQLRELLTLFDM